VVNQQTVPQEKTNQPSPLSWTQQSSVFQLRLNSQGPQPPDQPPQQERPETENVSENLHPHNHNNNRHRNSNSMVQEPRHEITSRQLAVLKVDRRIPVDSSLREFGPLHLKWGPSLRGQVDTAGHLDRKGRQDPQAAESSNRGVCEIAQQVPN